MIISKFNRYVEKHGRTTYIILGIIICFAFVIFVTPNQNAGGCGGPRRLTSVGEMYGRKIKVADFFTARVRTDMNSIVTTGVALSQYDERYLNYQTLSRMMMLHEARKGGYLRKVTDEQVADAIRGYAVFQNDKKEFDVTRFENFKNGFLRSNGMTAGDFDEMVRETLAIAAMENDVRSRAIVTDADIDNELAEYGISHFELPLNPDGDTAPSQAELDEFFAKRKAEIVPQRRSAAVVALFPPSAVNASKTAVTAEEIRKQYESGKDGLYAGKKLEQVSAEIGAYLKANKARAVAHSEAEAFLKKAQTAVAAQKPELASDAFLKLVMAEGVKSANVAYFTVGGVLPGMDGEHFMLADAIRDLEKAGQLTGVVNDNDDYAVALLANTEPGIVPDAMNDEYREKITAKLVEEKARKFYDEKIAVYKEAAANSSSVWDVVMPAANAIQQDKSLSIAERRKRLEALEELVRELVQPFYSAEQRSFSYVAFPYANYEKNVTYTDADIEREFNEHKADFEKQGKKTLADARADIVRELVKDGARRLALEDARKLSDDVTSAWNEGEHTPERSQAVLKSVAAAAKATVEECPFSTQFSYFAQGVAGDRTLMGAVFAATQEKPFTAGVAGNNAAYVACFTARVPAYLEEAEDRLQLLVNIYKRQISNEKTRARAEELVTKLNAGDASAAEATPFKAAEGTLTRKNLNESHGFYARDMEAVFAGLGALREKQVLAPQRTYGGYVLVRMDSRKLPSGDDAAAAREEARKNLKAQREQEVLADFYEQVQARADVKNLHSVLTGQRD